MTPLINDPLTFAQESLTAFAAANADTVLEVHGGVVRSEKGPAGRVAVVSGGGSGHFPAFAGWVGEGLLEGAACGAVFSSPSQHQIASVARSADNGSGVLFVPINYAGDILHFSAAADELRAEGIDVRMVAITDDIASGDDPAAGSRRGIAGSFPIVKILGAAAAAGSTLDELESLARRANDATRSFGVAFSGCTLPGADHPLFSIEPGVMAVGLGIHGEPGISETPVGTASEVADTIIDGLFAERAPEAGRQVAVLVNGLGDTKYDELHLVLARALERLRDAGMVPIAPVSGELMTSLDMAGLSISLTYLDDQSNQYWLAPASSLAFTRRSAEPGRVPRVAWHDVADQRIIAGSADAQGSAARLHEELGRVLDALRDAESELGDLDAIAGDGDHGIGMVRGAGAALEAADEALAAGAGLSTMLRMAGERWSEVSGGTSGALWGAGLVAAAAGLSDDHATSPREIVQAVSRFAQAITEVGGAHVGDKTMVDAVAPFAAGLAREFADGRDLPTAWSTAAQSAVAAAKATAEFPSRLGRSRLHGDRSLGHADPGATSFGYVVLAVTQAGAA